MSIANKIVVGLVGLTVMAVVFSAFLPIMGEVTSAEDTFTNKGVYYMTDDLTDYVLEYHGIAGDFYLGDTLICNRSDLPGGSWTLISTPDYLIRLQNFNAQSYNVWILGMDGTNRVIGNNTNELVTIAISEDTISINNDDLIYSYSGTFRGIAPSGDYVMTNGTDKPVVKNDETVIVGNGTTLVINWYDLFYLSGTVEDMDVDTVSGITVSDIAVNTVSMNDYINASTLNSVTFTATDGDDTTINATYDRIIVPQEVTLEKAVHPDGPTTAILNMLPIIVGAGLLIGAIAFMIVTRK